MERSFDLLNGEHSHDRKDRTTTVFASTVIYTIAISLRDIVLASTGMREPEVEV
jgi:hypothetical protein